MAYIRLVSNEEATGRLKEIFDAAIQRTDRVWNIVRTMSPNPAVMEASMGLYMQIMRGPSGLSRKERELIATVTSRANECHY